jgi:hypothetical protein
MYRSKRYPKMSAAQHWLTVAALDDMRVSHTSMTKVLDKIRQGGSTAAQDSMADGSGLSGWLSPASKAEHASVEVALQSVERVHGGDGMRVTLRLELDDMG